MDWRTFHCLVCQGCRLLMKVERWHCQTPARWITLMLRESWYLWDGVTITGHVAFVLLIWPRDEQWTDGWTDTGNQYMALNPLESRGNYSATSNNTKLVHWPSMGGLLHLLQRGGDWARPQPTQAPPCCTKCNSPHINSQCTHHCIAVRYTAVLMCP